MYNYNHLYYFYMTAKAGGVNAAAKHLRISQPSLSSQLKVLEISLNLRLFRKVGRTNQLTPAGSVIYGFCRQMFELSEEMGELISTKVPSASRRIHIGVSDEVDRSFVVEIVSFFLKQHGLIQRPKVTVVSGNHEQLMDRLRFRELDAVITQLVMMDPDLHNLDKAEVPVVLACPTDWKINTSKKSLLNNISLNTIRDREDLQWLLPSPRFKLRSEIDAFFAENELKGRVVFESDVIASLLRSVVDGIGLAFIPLIYASQEIKEGSIRLIGPKVGFWKYRVWLTSHSQNKDDVLIKALSRAFRTVCRQSSDIS